jgi:hypothetical protein
MGFEATFKIFNSPVSGGSGNCILCGNWLALPIHNKFSEPPPAKRLADICADDARFLEVAQQGSCSNPKALEEVCAFTCGSPASDPSNRQLDPTRPIRVRLRPVPTGDANYAVIGWHRQNEFIPIYAGTQSGGTAVCNNCANWVVLPLHTTARRLADLCGPRRIASFSQSGRATCMSGAASCAGEDSSVDPSFVDEMVTVSCGTFDPAVNHNPPIQQGRPVLVTPRGGRLRRGTGDFIWIPNHY